MYAQDLVRLDVNIAAEISKEAADNFQLMCKKFAKNTPTIWTTSNFFKKRFDITIDGVIKNIAVMSSSETISGENDFLFYIFAKQIKCRKA